MEFASTLRARAFSWSTQNSSNCACQHYNCVMLPRSGCTYAYCLRTVGGITSHLNSPSLIGSCHGQCPLHRQLLHALMHIQWEGESRALAPFVSRFLNFAPGHLDLQAGQKCLTFSRLFAGMPFASKSEAHANAAAIVTKCQETCFPTGVEMFSFVQTEGTAHVLHLHTHSLRLKGLHERKLEATYVV